MGSILAGELVEQGHRVIVLDSLEQGHKEAIAPEAVLVHADLGDAEALDGVFGRYQIDAVMHLAAETIVEHSITDPRRYFHTNVVCGIRLLDAMLKHGVDKLVFSSSAAVYGEPTRVPIKENDPPLPLNAYGESKLMFERILSWYGHAYRLKSISLRYFNAAGASERYGEDHDPETHLIPNVLKAALGKIAHVPVFGTDYETRDGSCIRDYVHVQDIAQAHLLALESIDNLNGRVYNLGCEEGYSVREVIETAKRITRAQIQTRPCPKRPGDPAVLIASSELARVELGWRPRYPDLGSIIESAWRWQKNHPDGYGSGVS